MFASPARVNASSARTPREAGFRYPAEWEPHDACWLAWPYRRDEWGDALAAAQQELTALCDALGVERSARGAEAESVELSIPPREHSDGGIPLRDFVHLHRLGHGDSWIRDTGPLWLTDDRGTAGAACFRFNGWGERYRIAGDDHVAARLAAQCDVPTWTFRWVLEGGAIDVDGEGTCLASRTCLLHPSRNPGADARTLERALRDALAVERVLWVDGALVGDHTDGHVDTLARFVAPGVVACGWPRDDSPSRDVLADVARQLERMRDARGRPLEIAWLPSPPALLGPGEAPLPASYCNFYVANTVVAVPSYDVPTDEEARRQLGALFPTRDAISLSARATLEGGGALHCITCPQFAAGRRVS